MDEKEKLQIINNNKNNIFVLIRKYLYIVVVDFSYLLHLSYHATEKDEVKQIDYILKIFFQIPGNVAAIVCLDSKNNFRKLFDNTYKAHRKHDKEIYTRLGNIYKTIAMFPNVFFARSNGFEADDIIASTFSKLYNYKKIYILSPDHDLSILRPKEFLKVDKASIKKFTHKCKYNIEVPTYKHDFKKALLGDSGDNIKRPVKRLPTAIIKKVLSIYDCVFDFIDDNSHPINKNKWVIELKKNENTKRLLDNVFLVKLRYDAKPRYYKIQGSLEYLEKIQDEKNINQFALILNLQVDNCNICQKYGRIINQKCINCF